MKKIDWSKAPAGATHHAKGDHIHTFDCWFRVEGGSVTDVWSAGINYKYFPGDRQPKIRGEKTERPSNWDGEGLPPVGTVCEVEWCEAWHKCEVIAHFQQRCAMVAAFTIEYSDGAKALDSYAAECFRPIKTPEQIAADEREHAVRNACTDIARTLDPFKDYIPSANAAIAVVRAMIDAGYRKQEAK